MIERELDLQFVEIGDDEGPFATAVRLGVMPSDCGSIIVAL